MNTVTKKENGFTIIEVVLVLAIAALIMLMVFLAWPALQRNQRDQARKSDISLLGSAIGTWKSNHQGNWPTAAQRAGLLNNISMSQYASTDIVWGTSITKAQMAVVQGQKCNTGAAPINAGAGAVNVSGALTTGSSRGGAVVIFTEGNGGTETAFCQDI